MTYAGSHGRPMRGGGTCQMPEGHRGRCASQVNVCELCDKVRRGGGSKYDGMWFCFMCAGLPLTRSKLGTF